jgi:4-hydroxymandelate synthase
VSVQRIDHVEFYVGDAERAAADLADGFGFTAGPVEDTDGTAGTRSVPAVQGGIRLRLTSSTDPAHRAADYVARHGDGVAVVALACPDAAATLDRALAHGARLLDAGTRTVAGFDDVALRFVQDGDPAAEAAFPAPAGAGLLDAIDHLAICVPSGTMADAVRFCEDGLGFRPIFSEYIEVGAQGMDSVVVQNPSGTVTFTLLEPDTRRPPGQIDDFLKAHQGVGVQHVAFRTDDIARTVRTCSERGVGFLTTPGTYYDALAERLAADSGIPVAALRELHVLVDQDHGGHLLQIFTRSVHSRHTFFFELIERRGAATFGTANIKALYEAVERQQAVATT